MRVELVDVTHRVVKNEIFGTCDLCFSTGDQTYVTLVFATDDGRRVDVETWYWSWGTLLEVHIANVVDFAKWVAQRGVEVERVEDMTYSWLVELVDDYTDDGGGHVIVE